MLFLRLLDDPQGLISVENILPWLIILFFNLIAHSNTIFFVVIYPCSRLDRILLAFMLQLVESKICDSEVLLRKLKHLLVAVLREPQPR